MNKKTGKFEYLALATIILSAVALRYFTLGSADIWDDEWFTAKFYSERAGYVQDFLIYVLIHISQSVLGESELALRLPSFLFGVGGVYVMFLLGKEIRSPAVGLLSAALLTLLPWHLFHSQYGRYYAAVVFFTALLYFFFLRALRRDSFAYLAASGITTLLLVSSHLTAILVPFCLWAICAVLYLDRSGMSEGLSRRFIRIGFWCGIGFALLALPFFYLKLMSWTGSPLQFTRSPAQNIFQYHAEAGVILLLAFYAVCTAFFAEQTRDRLFVLTYLGIATFLPIIVVVGASFVTSIRGDYGIAFIVPASVAAAITINSVWHDQHHGKPLSILLVLIAVSNMAPLLLSHYTDRLSKYSWNATEFLLEQRRPGDRIASFSPGVRFYLEEESLAVERTGLGSPYSAKDSWRNPPALPKNERLWLVFLVTRDDLTPPTIRWLREHSARLVWRQVSPRLDFRVQGVEIYLLCPPGQADCDNPPQPGARNTALQ